MQAMLEYSRNNYGPLPSELRGRRIRSRTSSRATPYPLPSVLVSVSSQQFFSSPPKDSDSRSPEEKHQIPAVPASCKVLGEVSTNVNKKSPPPSLDVIKPFTPFTVNVDFPDPKESKNEMGLPVPTRPRVTSSARRTALGWSKRSTGKSSSSDYKENTGSMVITYVSSYASMLSEMAVAHTNLLRRPSETLRINRPRPRGRPTPARVPVPRV